MLRVDRLREIGKPWGKFGWGKYMMAWGDPPLTEEMMNIEIKLLIFIAIVQIVFFFMLHWYSSLSIKLLGTLIDHLKEKI